MIFFKSSLKITFLSLLTCGLATPAFAIPNNGRIAEVKSQVPCNKVTIHNKLQREVSYAIVFHGTPRTITATKSPGSRSSYLICSSASIFFDSSSVSGSQTKEYSVYSSVNLAFQFLPLNTTDIDLFKSN
jgi:hypothetical protein